MEEVAQITDPSLVTVIMLVQSGSSLVFLQALYDQSAQLLTLSTATAAIFVSLSDKNRVIIWLLWVGLGVLAASAGTAVWMMARLTELMGKERGYTYADLSAAKWRITGDGLDGLHGLHLASLILLALGVFLFVLAKVCGPSGNPS